MILDSESTQAVWCLLTFVVLLILRVIKVFIALFQLTVINVVIIRIIIGTTIVIISVLS